MLQALLDDVDTPVKLARQKEELLTTLMGGRRSFAADAGMIFTLPNAISCFFLGG